MPGVAAVPGVSRNAVSANAVVLLLATGCYAEEKQYLANCDEPA